MKRFVAYGVACLVLAFFAAPVAAVTECDTDPAAVDFVPTVNPTLLNALLGAMGDAPIDASAGFPVSFPGLCVTHNVVIGADIFTLPADEAAFTVTPGPGSLRVDLDVLGPFAAGAGTSGYHTTSCSSLCVVDLPYLGEVFDGCDFEGDIIGPIVGSLSASASWDDIIVTQVADTCVLGDCTAVHPLETSSASIPGFDIDFTGIGSCEVCIEIPDVVDLGCFDPCKGLDPVIESVLRPELEELIAGAFVNGEGEGLLINVFSNQITKDYGCIDIPEVRECEQAQNPGVASLDKGRAVNAIFYALPFALALGLVLRRKRR